MIELFQTFEEYQKTQAINFSSWLKPMIKGSPLHVAHVQKFGSGDNTGRLQGRATHCLALEPQTFPERFAVFEIEGKDRRSKEWKEFAAANPGKGLLKANEFAECSAQAGAIRSNKHALKYLGEGQPEISITWHDAETGLLCKCRIDWLSNGSERAIVDLKGVPSIEKRALELQASKECWAHQAAHYIAGWAANNSGELLKAVMIAHEIEPPHDVGVFVWDGEALMLCEREISEAMRRIVECKRTKTWAGRYDGEQLISLPAWKFAAEQDALMQEEMAGGAYAAQGER